MLPRLRYFVLIVLANKYNILLVIATFSCPYKGFVFLSIVHLCLILGRGGRREPVPQVHICSGTSTPTKFLALTFLAFWIFCSRPYSLCSTCSSWDDWSRQKKYDVWSSRSQVNMSYILSYYKCMCIYSSVFFFFLRRIHNSLQILKGVDDHNNVTIHYPIIL